MKIIVIQSTVVYTLVFDHSFGNLYKESLKYSKLSKLFINC